MTYVCAQFGIKTSLFLLCDFQNGTLNFELTYIIELCLYEGEWWEKEIVVEKRSPETYCMIHACNVHGSMRANHSVLASLGGKQC